MIRTILKYPDSRLRETAQLVSRFDADLAALVDDMAETMYAAPGVGLAAPQIGVALRVFLVDISPKGDNLRVFINPEIIECDGEASFQEGCLSFPGVFETVRRFNRVKIQYQSAKGMWQTLEVAPSAYDCPPSTGGLLSVVIQHELDHLNGKLMIDHLGVIKKRLIQKTMAKRKSTTQVY